MGASYGQRQTSRAALYFSSPCPLAKRTHELSSSGAAGCRAERRHRKAPADPILCPLWVKLRNTQHEQMSSAFPPRTDVGSARPQNIARIFRDLPCRAGLKRAAAALRLCPPAPARCLSTRSPCPSVKRSSAVASQDHQRSVVRRRHDEMRTCAREV